MKELLDRLFSGGLLSSFFTEPFSQFGWRDVLDISCLIALFFALYLFVRNRRAGKLLAGLAALIVILVCSYALNLTALRYLFANAFGYGLVLLAIIFQPELRAALERLGSLPFRGLESFGGESKDFSGTPVAVDAVVQAAKAMSFSKTGALIVIERSTKIGEYIRTGTTLNADLTPELLRAIFFDKAPLHDGAVIIRNGRIFAAGCYLPLSDKLDISKDLGARHRAALGLSEQCDAITVVVSEETGNISIAYKGELFRGFTSVSLRRKLFELMRREENKEQKDRRD